MQDIPPAAEATAECGRLLQRGLQLLVHVGAVATGCLGEATVYHIGSEYGVAHYS